ncbi:MAG: hypothetical protein ACI4I9_02660 [Porcipelethomonas sp.]
MALTAYNAFNNKRRKLDHAFALLMCAGFFSYIPHYLIQYNLLNAILCDVVNLFQIVTLNSNSYETYQPEISESFWFYLCIMIRGVVHISSPILGTVAAYNFVCKQLEKWRAKHICSGKDTIFVFSSFNEKAIKIAESMADNINNKKTAFIFYDVDKTDYNLEEKLGYKGIAHISHKMKMDVEISHLPNLNLKKQSVNYLLLEESDENLNIGILLNKYYNQKVDDGSISNDDLLNLHITLFSNQPIEDEEIIDSIPTNIDLRVVNEEKIIVYKLLQDVPLYVVDENKDISVLITGYGKTGREFLFAAIAAGQIPGRKIKFNILAENTEKEIDYLNLYYPEILSNYDIQFHETIFNSTNVTDNISEYAKDANYIFVCGDSDSANIKMAVLIRKYFLSNLSENNDFSNMPVITVNIKSDAKAETIKSSRYGLFPFGYESQLYSYNEIVNPELESLAKRVHFAYCRSNKDCLKENIKSYYTYERNRKSSLALALSLQYKLHSLGFVISKNNNDGDDMELLRQTISEMDLKEISESEHRRWMAYMRTEGYVKASIEKAVGLVNSPFSEKINNKPGQSIYMNMHMDICDIDDITPCTEKYNRIMNELGYDWLKEDTTSKDEVIIRQIPDILSNKDWNEVANIPEYCVKKI